MVAGRGVVNLRGFDRIVDDWAKLLQTCRHYECQEAFYLSLWLVVRFRDAGSFADLGLAGGGDGAGQRQGQDIFPQAVAQADGRIQDIVHHFRRDLTIDTVESIPADMQAEYQQSGKAKFFLDWADRRQGQAAPGNLRADCKNPGHLEIVLDKSIREHGFTFADRDLLAKQMLGLLKEKRYDAALAEAVNFVDSRLRAHQGRRRPLCRPSRIPAARRTPPRARRSWAGFVLGWPPWWAFGS